MSIRSILVLAVATTLVANCASSNDPSDGCPAGYTSKKVCVQCGIAGGCARSETKCAQNCSSGNECSDGQPSCFEDVCQVGGCI
ncbi:MAG TPA: hypothetical protein VK540_09880 [Polyangiaceae bacterium]|nr:hypothetical protein [Polyangiaceae bacterium]